jgi:SHS2 domain-containing protein
MKSWKWRTPVLVPRDDPVSPSKESPASAPVFEILEHPADIGFRAFGGTLAELFETAALALLSIACDLEDVAARDEHHVEAAAMDYESLLVAWLNEVLYWFDGKRIAFRQFRVEEIEPERITALGWGEPRAADRHRAKLIVKAVTWHQLKVTPYNGGWMAEVYLDV